MFLQVHLILIGLLLCFLGYMLARKSGTIVWVCLLINHLLTISYVLGHYAYVVAGDEWTRDLFLVGHVACGLLLALGWLILALHFTQSRPDCKAIIMLHVPVVAVIIFVAFMAAPGAQDVQASSFRSGGLTMLLPLWVMAVYSAASSLVLVYKMQKKQLTSRYQVGLLLIGTSVLPFAAGADMVLQLAGVVWAGPPLPVLSTVICACCHAFGFLHFDIVDIVRRGVYENLREVILVLDLEGRVADMNLAAQRLNGKMEMVKDLNQLQGNLADKMETPRLFEDLARHMGKGVAEPFEGELVLREETKNRYFAVYALPVDVRGGIVGWVVTMDDVTRLQADLDRARLQAITDDLTGLYNRRFLSTELFRQLGHGNANDAELALLMIDIDHFKHINDTFGHHGGDRILAAIANVIRDCLRPSDTVGRYGGEEFIVMCPGTNLQGGIALAERLRQAVGGHHFRIEQEVVKVTISVGVAVLNPRAEATGSDIIEELLKNADRALYEAKSAGRNRVAVATSLEHVC